MRGESGFEWAVPVASLLLALGLGCASNRWDNLRIQAADDFACPSADVTGQRIDRGRWRVTGCRTTAIYVCSQRRCERQREPRTQPPPTGRTPQTWSDEAALAALRSANSGVMECLPEREEPLTLRVELQRDGTVGRVSGLNELSREASRCVRGALADVRIASRVDVSRVVRFAFGATSNRPTPNVAVHNASGRPLPQAGVGPPPTPAPPADPPPVMPPSEPRAGEAELRAALQARTEVVLACVNRGAAAVIVEWSAEGAVEVSMQGSLAGSAEEGCVRQALSSLTMPPGPPGRLIHPFSP